MIINNVMSQQHVLNEPLACHSHESKLLHNLRSLKMIIASVVAATAIVFFITALDTPLSSSNPFPGATLSASTSNKTHNHKAIIMKSPKQYIQCNATLPKIDRNCKAIDKFTTNGPQVCYKGPSQKWSQLMAFHRIPYNQTYKVKAQVIFSANRHIIFGITNHQRIESHSSFFNEDTYAYYGANGCLWIQGDLMMKDEIGYCEKEVVEVIVRLWEGLVEWKVNDRHVAQIFSQNLKDESKDFVVYLQMFQKDDLVRFII